MIDKNSSFIIHNLRLFLIVYNFVENSVDNYCDMNTTSCRVPYKRDYAIVLKDLSETFPPFYDEKRYKLCNFAPKRAIVDKWRNCLCVKK
jgi:hypothetical protein